VVAVEDFTYPLLGDIEVIANFLEGHIGILLVHLDNVAVSFGFS